MWESFKEDERGVKHDKYTVDFQRMKQISQKGKERDVRVVAWKRPAVSLQ